MGSQEWEDILAIVCAVYRKCGHRATVHCHLPVEAILSMFPPWMRKYYKKALRNSVRKGYVYEKPHGKGRRSYGLTKAGVELALTQCIEE